MTTKSSLLFKICGLSLVFCVIVQLGFSLLFVQSFKKRDPRTIATFCVVSVHTLLAIGLVCAQHYKPMLDPFFKRAPLVVYHMSGAVKLIMFTSEAPCVTCIDSGALRIVAALIENILSNMIYSHIWRDPDFQDSLNERTMYTEMHTALASTMQLRDHTQMQNAPAAADGSETIDDAETTAARSSSMQSIDMKTD